MEVIIKRSWPNLSWYSGIYLGDWGGMQENFSQSNFGCESSQTFPEHKPEALLFEPTSPVSLSPSSSLHTSTHNEPCVHVDSILILLGGRSDFESRPGDSKIHWDMQCLSSRLIMEVYNKACYNCFPKYRSQCTELLDFGGFFHRPVF